jgi:hypothetical protein
MRLSSMRLLSFCAIGLSAIFCAAMPARASHPGTVSGSVTVKGTATAPASGPCPVSGIAGSCPDGDCMCITVPNATVIGGLHGSISLFATIDAGEENPVAPCTPVYVSISGTLSGGHQASPVSGDAFVVQCTGGKVAGGGWGMATPGNTVTGTGTVLGTFDGTNGKVTLKLSGTLTTH